MNLMVRSAHDPGIYCVDVGVTVAGAVPQEKKKTKWECLDNKKLITFAEVKKLVVFPMLLAQFLGIVHEIKPKFLRGRAGLAPEHLPPMLVALGYFSGNSTAIITEYKRRRINVTIAANYDMRLANVRNGAAKSPFEMEDELLARESRAELGKAMDVSPSNLREVLQAKTARFRSIQTA